MLSKILPLVIVVMVMLGAFHPGHRHHGRRTRARHAGDDAVGADRAFRADGGEGARGGDARRHLRDAQPRLDVADRARGRAAGAGRAAASLPWLNARPALAVVPPAAFLFASVMVAIGALARSFKEAQTLLTPVYFLCMAPSLLAALGDFELSGAAALIPGVGVTLLARDLIVGHASRRRDRWRCSPARRLRRRRAGAGGRLYDSERLLGATTPALGLRAWLRHLVFGRRAGGRRRPAAASDGRPRRPPPGTRWRCTRSPG